MTGATSSAPPFGSELRMPSLGADMEHGVLVKWHVKPGDAVKPGDVVAEVETQKGVFSIDVREAGVVEALLVPEESRVPVGSPLARLRVAAAEAAPPTVVPESPVAPSPVALPATPSAPPPRLKASPLARRVAEALGVDLARVVGTGEGGAITRQDVERAAEARGPVVGAAPSAAPTPAAEPVSAVTPSAAADHAAAMRQAIAAAMAKSKREIPHYYLGEEIELGHAMAWLRDANASREVTQRLLPAALLLKSVARALRKFREFNGLYADGQFHPSERIHLGVAIALRGGGLVAPALHDADTRSLDDLGRALLDLVSRARTGGLRTSEITDPTVTVTSLGDAGARSVFGVIYPPQVAIIGFGAIRERPWASGGMLGVRPAVTVTLAADHRVSDGHRGALFLGEIARLLQQPEAL